ncbi:SDR family NAD(P)-dependent oxidoreductase [Erwinia rhapontici]|uniref:SDR family NAD(P)-dependent oxidoreductase n=1 Tax=Erwinia rhapontici TaxID=55212 RepID=UPI0021688E6D|nr:SDR family NAD(P)-dependent oxidoreductase [Erwinia rhapontici]MCS3605665.1 NAD(P)-dependent dehydrogenase (short-subunit alcohol dehydrogenase family) [Erwinia rhapontici]
MGQKNPLTDALLKDAVAIITGAGQGLGRAYAQSLLDHGARVVISDLGTNRAGEGASKDVIAEAGRTLRADNGQLIAHNGRLDNEDGCRELVELAITHFGKLDILIHNAGWVDYQRIEDQSDDFLERAIGINVRAPIWLSKYAWAYLKHSSSPRIVLNTSDRALFQQYAQPGLVAYAAGKMAQVGIMNALSLEGEQHGILVNAISPVAKTRMWGCMQSPENLKPEWVAPGVVYLASPLCHDTGYILRASNGHFTATRFCENPGVVYPTDLARVECENVADVARQWQQIKECEYA